MLQSFKQEQGHTIVEVLTALIILLIVIWPAISFFSKIMTASDGNILLIATNLAEQEMEQTLLERDFNKRKQPFAELRLQLEKEITREDQLITISVTISSAGSEKKLVQLQRIYLQSATNAGLQWLR